MFGFLSKENPDEIWSKTDVLIMPSTVEGFGLVYIEAMSRGIPIITSKQDAGHEINLHGKTGYSADLNNKKKMNFLFIWTKFQKIIQN